MPTEVALKAREGDVDIAGLKSWNSLRAIDLSNRYSDQWIVLLKPLDQRGQYIDHCRGNRPNRYYASMAGHGLMHRKLQSFQLISKLSYGGENGGSRSGQLSASARPSE